VSLTHPISLPSSSGVRVQAGGRTEESAENTHQPAVSPTTLVRRLLLPSALGAHGGKPGGKPSSASLLQGSVCERRAGRFVFDLR